jgi:hypothetical protein
MGRPNNHGYAALAREDVADAKAGTSGVDLRGYAAERGLEVIAGSLPAGYDAAVPRWPQYMENLMRGVLPGGEYGLLMHEKLELAKGGGMSGTLYSVHYGNATWKSVFKPSFSFNRTDIPIIGDFLNPPTDHRPPEPFEGESAWVPCTLAVIRVPSTTVVLPQLRIDRRHHHGPYDFADHRGLGDGWHLRTGPGTDPGALERLLGGPALALLQGADVPFLQLVVHEGTMLLRRNGYLRDAAALDAYAQAACTLASELRSACLPAAARRPFTEPLPAWNAREAELPPPWIEAFQALAARLGMTLEDPDALHRSQPSLEVVRGAVLLPAVEGASTPLGGLREEAPVVAEVRDGVLACWSRRTSDRTFSEVDQLVAASLRAARRYGLAAV